MPRWVPFTFFGGAIVGFTFGDAIPFWVWFIIAWLSGDALFLVWWMSLFPRREEDVYRVEEDGRTTVLNARNASGTKALPQPHPHAFEPRRPYSP